MTDNIAAVKVIIENKGLKNINDNRTKFGFAPIHKVANKGNIKMMRLLLNHLQIDLNMPTFDTKFTALHIAIKQGNIEIIKLLVKNGANVNVKDMRGNAPIHYATILDNEEILEYLLENGANINIKNNDEKDALELAIGQDSKTLAWKVSSYMVASGNSQNINVQNIEKEKEIINTQYNIFKDMIKNNHKELLNDAKAQKIVASFSNDNYFQHSKVVREDFKKRQAIHQKLQETNSNLITEDNKKFLKSLELYQKDIERFSINFSKIGIVTPTNETTKRETITDNLKQPLPTFSLSQVQEPRTFVKKESRTPLKQQAKIRNVATSKGKSKDRATKAKSEISSKSQFIV